MMRYSHSKKGFSLIEVMVYLAVTVLLAGALITSFISLSTVLARNATERALTTSAQVSLERMVRTARSAESVNTGLSTLDTSMGALALTESATTTRFYVSGDALMVSVNGTELGPLTSDAVSVEDVVFHRYVASTSEMVRMELTLSAVSKAASSTRTFYSSAVLRGSYE
jgi:Tfp pilus assembly protein PilW